MAPRPTITIRRAELPRWLPVSSGEVYLDERRIALLIGGRPRTITVRPGERTIGVKFTDPRWPLGVTRSIHVEDGRSYQYRRGVQVQNRWRTYASGPPIWRQNRAPLARHDFKDPPSP